MSIVHSADQAALGTTIELKSGVVIVGRDVDDGLRINDPALSRTHFRIVCDPRENAFLVGDAGSRNGTRIDGRRIDSAMLANSSVVRAGDTLLVYSEYDALSSAFAKADSLAESDVSVLIVGETGVGKELLARRIHRASGRKGEFVPVNCATLPRELTAAELFGFRRGAFSGANEPRPGLFVHADSGTLLLDEVGDCPADVQAALLRVLQERKVRPLGADREVAVDVRVLAATLVDLSERIQTGRFRADLYARLAETVIQLPPLRERRGELLDLAERFAAEFGRELSITTNAAEALLLWRWPYNVRELRGLIRSFVHSTEAGRALDLAYLRSERPEMCCTVEAATDRVPSVHPGAGNQLRREQLERLLKLHAGNVSAVAEALGKARSHVYRSLRALSISPDRFRKGGP